MVDEKIKMNVNETLELDYLVEEVSRDIVTIDKNPSGLSDHYISEEKYVFDPSGTGTYKISLKNQVIEIEVTDIPDSGVSRWTFDDDDTESGTALDSWGNNDGTISGATTGVTGANQTNDTAEAYSFDGTGDVINMGQTLGLVDTDHTVAAWVKTGSDSDQHLAGRFGSNASERWHYRINEVSGRWSMVFEIDYNDDNEKVAHTGTDLTDNTWYHFAGVWDVSNLEVQFYIDGTADGGGTAGGDWGDPVADFTIGNSDNGTTSWNGRIDDVRIYDKALSSTEVSNLYNTGSIDG
jgi:hypothetical protein